jgi:hypothetical protein
MTFWCGSGSGSGSAHPWLWIMGPDPDSDPDPVFFVIDLQDDNKKLILKKNFLLIRYRTFWRCIYIIFQYKKSKKKPQSCRNQGFSYHFCLVIEGCGSGSIPQTSWSGSGSRRHKNKNIRIRRVRIRICNTGVNLLQVGLILGSWVLLKKRGTYQNPWTVETV